MPGGFGARARGLGGECVSLRLPADPAGKPPGPDLRTDLAVARPDADPRYDPRDSGCLRSLRPGAGLPVRVPGTSPRRSRRRADRPRGKAGRRAELKKFDLYLFPALV